MNPDRLEAARESAAEHADQLRYREVEECAVAVRLELARQLAAEIALDIRSPQRPQLIRGGRRTIGMSEYTHVLFELVGTVERDEQLIVESRAAGPEPPRFFPGAPA